MLTRVYRALVIAALFLPAFALHSAHAQTFKVITNLTVNSTADPFSPQYLGLFAQARDGNLYSTSQNGGTFGKGVVFRLTPAGKVTTLYNFDGTTGSTPRGGLTLGSDGSLYGTACSGGAFNNGNIFKITTAGAFTVIHDFNLSNNEGYCPEAAPVQGTDGNFYGTTIQAPNPYHGTIYKVTPTGTLTTLVYLENAQAENAFALVPGVDGNFYGTSRNGGAHNEGTVFKVTPAGVFTLLHSFDGTDGNLPIGPIAQGADGNFYGASQTGLNIYKITPAGVYTNILPLNITTTGFDIIAGLTAATDGNLYTAATAGGANGAGTILQITPAGVGTIEHSFAITPDGFTPQTTLVQHTNGTLFGTTSAGGTGLGGTIYSLSMGLKPFVLLQRASGKTGSTVQILGNGLTGTTGVKFGTVAATFTVVSDSYMTAVVPATAISAPIRVTAPTGVRTSSKTFKVTPTIASFTPTSGPAGTQVVVTGTGLTAASKVTFNQKTATFTVNSATQITATVPTTATTGKIAVTTAGGTATSATAFTVTQ